MGSGECQGWGAPWRDPALFIFILLHFPTHSLVFSYFAWFGNGFPSLILHVFIAHLLCAGTTAVNFEKTGPCRAHILCECRGRRTDKNTPDPVTGWDEGSHIAKTGRPDGFQE